MMTAAAVSVATAMIVVAATVPAIAGGPITPRIGRRAPTHDVLRHVRLAPRRAHRGRIAGGASIGALRVGSRLRGGVGIGSSGL